ncbi:helix-turn-helix transcriptional regulator [Nocardiopsis sp. RSe5-2]|uniref:Helix-turn-helix transcriptional regulator n=1 Tax=Nocardiopsis endophytica TaxID=3018445 RepID=A0ABT4UEG4_9ACTN|nr:helix-turn-helix transcriptional regulator [Nocardiopsis endophytica]MDA2814864.1 helix-turn-helix transcriptional regulator [Nocardiopsis endophytica]
MADQKRQSIRRRRLSAEVKKARIQAGMTIDDVAEATEWSVGKISNIETGVRLRPTVMEIKGLLDVYGVTDESKREALLSLTRQAREKGWWSKYSDIFVSEYPAFESEARVIHTYELAMIPGLLQTPGYVELLQRAILRRNPLDIDRVIETRKQRQAILAAVDAPEYWAVIDEGALRRFESDVPVFREQVQHLIDLAEDDNTVTIQVLPFSSGMHAGLKGSFVLLDFVEGVNPIVYTETDTDGLYLEDSEEIDRYRRLFDHVRTSARYPDASLQIMKDMLKDHR